MKNKKVTSVNHDTIFIRKMYHYKLTRFCVDSNGHKMYWDNNVRIPYSSGQQQKYALIEELLSLANEENAPSELIYEYDATKDGSLNHKVYRITTDLRHLESYMRGYMYNEDIKNDKGEDKKAIYVRNSPFKISCLSAVHPSLINVHTEAHVVVDRRGRSNCEITINDSKTKTPLTAEKTTELLKRGNFNGPLHFVPNSGNQGVLVTGFYQVDIEVNLKQLFKTRLSNYERTLPDAIKNDLLANGWYITKEKHTEYINPPNEFIEHLLKFLPEAILNFTSKTNQSRNYSVPELLSFAITNDAYELSRISTIEKNDDGKNTFTFNANENSISDHTSLFIDTVVARNHDITIDGDKFEDMFPKDSVVDTIKEYLISKS